MAPHSSVILSGCLNKPEQNHFNFLRLLAALLVLLTHCFELFPGEDPVFHLTRGLINPSFLGLAIFFFLSGLLVTQSLRRSPSWKNFLWRRFLRIYPAAWFVIFLCAFVAGPLLTSLTLKDYFTEPGFYRFLANGTLARIHFTLPGVFHNEPGDPGLIAQFWSITLELKLYIALLLAWLIKWPGKTGKRILLFAVTGAALVLNLFFHDEMMKMLFTLLPHAGTPYAYTLLIPLFALGVLCNLFRDRILINRYWILILPILLVLSIYNYWQLLTVFVIVPASILAFAALGPAWIGKITPRADLSYGIYLFGGPAWRLVTVFAHPSGPWESFFGSLLVTVPLAALSWYALERRMLSLKNRVS